MVDTFNMFKIVGVDLEPEREVNAIVAGVWHKQKRNLMTVAIIVADGVFDEGTYDEEIKITQDIDWKDILVDVDTQSGSRSAVIRRVNLSFERVSKLILTELEGAPFYKELLSTVKNDIVMLRDM